MSQRERKDRSVGRIGSEEDIISYLLGDLEPVARAALDERFREEPSFLEMAMSIEDDMLVEYVRGGHAEERRARIETAYSETAARRARVEAARAFVDAVPRAARARSRPWSTAWSARYPIGAALAAAALFAVLWFPSRKYTESPRNETDASFELAPGRMRSGAGKQITLPPGARIIKLDLQVPDPKLFRRWNAELGTVERAEIWSGPAVPGKRYVSAIVPASALAAGDYTLILRGGDTSTGTEERATYYFRVE